VEVGSAIETDVVVQTPSDLEGLLVEAAARAERSTPISTPLRTQLVVGSVAIVVLSGVVVFVVAAFAPSIAVGVSFMVDQLSAIVVF
jgi:hypothetical protein